MEKDKNDSSSRNNCEDIKLVSNIIKTNNLEENSKSQKQWTNYPWTMV